MSIEYIHAQPCACVCCDTARLRAFAGPSILYRATRSHSNNIGNTTTWTLKHFEWTESIVPGELIYVVRELEPGEKGGHMDGVLIIPLDGKDGRFSRAPHMCTSKKWIEPA